MKTKKAALIEKGRVIGEVYDAPEAGITIKIAETFTSDGTPANIKLYKISRSKKNLLMAAFEQPISKIETKNGTFWTFLCVDNNTIVY